MKEGAGEDPFADSDDAASSTESTNPESDSSLRESEIDEEGAKRSKSDQRMDIPYKYRRDGVKDGRDRVPLFLHEDTKRRERDALRELEERFDDNVSLTDLREALVKVGLENIDNVEEELEEWGYGMTFE